MVQKCSFQFLKMRFQYLSQLQCDTAVCQLYFEMRTPFPGITYFIHFLILKRKAVGKFKKSRTPKPRKCFLLSGGGGCTGALQTPIVAARDPLGLHFGDPKLHFGCPGTYFPTPRHPSSSINFPFPQSSSPPCLQSSKVGEAECAERLNNSTHVY